jgi:hypothetical protein
MYEPTATARTRDAFKAAHAERSATIKIIFSWMLGGRSR